MAKRVIHECDLTKQEFDPEIDKVFILSIHPKGRKAPMKYELSASAGEKLLTQLNGRETLEEDWRFSNGDYASVMSDEKRPGRTLEDLELETIADDTKFVASKKAELREAGIISDEDNDEPTEQPLQKAISNQTNGCAHINKGRIQVTMRGGKRFVYRKCTECKADIQEMTAEARQSYMNGKAPKGVNIKDL